jgi:putative peptidoglycan lipid II flippase
MFPYLFCISLVAMSAGVLNTVNRFAIPAVTPVLLNICLLLAMWLLIPLLDNAAQALAIGVLIAGLIVTAIYLSGAQLFSIFLKNI